MLPNMISRGYFCLIDTESILLTLHFKSALLVPLLYNILVYVFVTARHFYGFLSKVKQEVNPVVKLCSASDSGES